MILTSTLSQECLLHHLCRVHPSRPQSYQSHRWVRPAVRLPQGSPALAPILPRSSPQHQIRYNNYFTSLSEEKSQHQAFVDEIVYRKTPKRMQNHRLPRLQRGRKGRSQFTPSPSTRMRSPRLVSSCHQRSTRMICTTKVVKNQPTTTTPRQPRRRHLSQEHPGRRRRR